MLLINGVPVVQVELKTLGISPRRAMEQIVEYKNDPGNGYTKTILCFLQLFIVSNRDRTFYFANNNARHFTFNAEERFLPVYEFADVDNKKIVHLDSFAESFLVKCTLGQTIKVRFPEFQGAAAWEPMSLRKATVPVDERVGERKLTPVSISAGIGFVPQAEKFGRDISGNQYQLYTLVRDGDFVFNKGNSLKFPQGCIYLLQGWGEVAAPNVFIAFRLKDGYSNGFFQNCFEQNQHGKQLKKHITSGARSNGLLNISKETFFNVEIPTPRFPEQQKIAECLDSADALIAAQGRKVEALKAHKKGLMQQLFPQDGETQPRLRFPEFGGIGEWEERHLESLAKRGSGHTPSKSKPEYYDGGVKWISLADSRRLDQGLICETDSEISGEGIRNSSAVLHKTGSVLISRDAGIGKSAVMALPMAVSQHFIVWTCDDKKLSNWFLYYLLQKSKPLFERAATGSTIKTIGLQFFIELRLRFPSRPEQQRIADCLTSLDTLITAETRKLKTLRTHKRGLMQQLFPQFGEVDA